MIYKALSDFHSNVGTIKKDSLNPHFKNKYADINTVLEAIRDPLKQAGLSFTQLPQENGLKTILSTIDGKEQIESFIPYILAKSDMQQLGSAITYARRYALISLLGLEAEDDDGHEASKPRPTVQTKETMGSFLTAKGLTSDQIKAFCASNNITAVNAPDLLKDKTGLSNKLETWLAVG